MVQVKDQSFELNALPVKLKIDLDLQLEPERFELRLRRSTRGSIFQFRYKFEGLNQELKVEVNRKLDARLECRGLNFGTQLGMLPVFATVYAQDSKDSTWKPKVCLNLYLKLQSESLNVQIEHSAFRLKIERSSEWSGLRLEGSWAFENIKLNVKVEAPAFG